MLAVVDMLEWLRVIEKLLRSDANSTFYCSAKVSRPSVLTQNLVQAYRNVLLVMEVGQAYIRGHHIYPK